MKNGIEHIWFDMSDTLAVMSTTGQKVHSDYKYKIYSQVMGKENNSDLQKEFDLLFAEKKSITNIFYSLGKPKDFWANELHKIDNKLIYERNENIIGTLQQLKSHLPISLFTNTKPELILPDLGIELSWFTHILDANKIAKPKPALDGFYQMIEITGLPPQNILYVADSEGKDIIPAKKVGLQTAIVWGKSDKSDYTCENFVELIDLIN